MFLFFMTGLDISLALKKKRGRMLRSWVLLTQSRKVSRKLTKKKKKEKGIFEISKCVDGEEEEENKK